MRNRHFDNIIVHIGVFYDTSGSSTEDLLDSFSDDEPFEKAVEEIHVMEETKGFDHIEVACMLVNLAAMHEHRHIYTRDACKKEILLYERALAIWEKEMGPEHPCLIYCLACIAVLYLRLGKTRLSNAAFERASSIAMKMPSSPLTISKNLRQAFKHGLPQEEYITSGLRYMACLYLRQKKVDKAISLYELAIAISPPWIPFDCWKSLFDIYLEQGDMDKAEDLLDRFIIPLNSNKDMMLFLSFLQIGRLVDLYCKQGQYAKALSLCERELAAREKANGPDDPFVIEGLDHLAYVYCEQDQQEQVDRILERKWKILRNTSNQNDCIPRPDMCELGDKYAYGKQYVKAEEIYNRTIMLMENEYGSDSPSVARCLERLANICVKRKQYSRAQSLYERSLGIMEKTYGPDAEQIPQRLLNLAEIHRAQGQYELGESLCMRAISISDMVFEPDSYRHYQPWMQLEKIYKAQGKKHEAKAMRTRIHNLRKIHASVDIVEIDLSSLDSCDELDIRNDPWWVRIYQIFRRLTGRRDNDD